MDQPVLSDSPFVFLTFLVAPAILTNASTLLALGTSNRLARAADRARAAAIGLVTPHKTDDPMRKLQHEEFLSATLRSKLLIRALRRFYLASGCFAGGTSVALAGAFINYLTVHALDQVMQVGTVLIALAGVGALIAGSAALLHETLLALRMLDLQQTAISAWRDTRQPTDSAPGL